MGGYFSGVWRWLGGRLGSKVAPPPGPPPIEYVFILPVCRSATFVLPVCRRKEL